MRDEWIAEIPDTPLPIEVMGGLEVRTASGWSRAAPASRIRVDIVGGDVFVPDRDEQSRLLRLFGRPKDVERAAMLTHAPKA